MPPLSDARVRPGIKPMGLILGLVGLFASGEIGRALAANPDPMGLLVDMDVSSPAAVANLTAGAGATEGSVQLTWTAPDDDVPAGGSPVSSYIIKAATFSADSLGGNTTSWWNSADTLAVLGSALPPGSPETLLASGLEPGATYYFALKSKDNVGYLSPIDIRAGSPGLQASAVATDLAPAAPANLTAAVASSDTIVLTWDAVGVFDLDLYRVYADSTAPYDFGDSFAMVVDSGAVSFAHGDLVQDTTYFYFVKAVDKGQPGFAGLALESPPSNLASGMISPSKIAPMAPFGIGIRVEASTTTLSWKPVPAFEDGRPFGSYASPRTFELTGYRVYRATAPTRAPWAEMTALSTGAYAWSDTAGGPQYYYRIKAENTIGISKPSTIRSQATRSAYVVADDGESSLEIPPSWFEPLLGAGTDPATAYRLEVSSRPGDLGGRVLKSLEFKAFKGGTSLAPDLELGGTAALRLHYELEGAVVAPSGAQSAAVVPTPDHISVYWFNGSRWVQLYGKADEPNQAVAVQTKYLGRYQLRSVERTSGFNFNSAGVSNRFLTPNGDRKNDFAVFTFDNPRDSEVKGRIFDLRGAFVAEMTRHPGLDAQRQLVWDGRSRGNAVPPGAYIYQIEAEDKVFNGTVVVIR